VKEREEEHEEHEEDEGQGGWQAHTVNETCESRERGGV